MQDHCMPRRQPPSPTRRAVETVIVALPGTGSDADFAARAFANTDLPVIAVDPDGTGLISGYRRALDDAARRWGPIVAAGVSIGACVAVHWAIDNPEQCAGVLAALPPWVGDPATAPAAHSAHLTLDLLHRLGLEGTITSMEQGSPPWLAAELARSWRAVGDQLEPILAEAATYHAPTTEAISRLRVPLAITAATDDPVHPYAVAQVWRAHAPTATLADITLAELGADPSVLGRRALEGWRSLCP
jgi:pimeloyl-ACP methyl ester carboxylesterase